MVSRSSLIRVLLAVLCTAVIGIMGAFTLYHAWYVLDEHSVLAKFEVVEETHAGFDLNRTALTFGKIPQGGGGTRSATIQTNTKAKTTIEVDASFQGWLVPESYEVLTEPGTPVKVTFALNVPADAPPGNYSGYITLRSTRRLWS